MLGRDPATYRQVGGEMDQLPHTPSASQRTRVVASIKPPPRAHRPSIDTSPSHSTRRDHDTRSETSLRNANTSSPDLHASQSRTSPESPVPAYETGISSRVSEKDAPESYTQRDKHGSHSPRLSSSPRASLRDLEKASCGPQSPQSHYTTPAPSQRTNTIYTDYDDPETDTDDPKRHAMWILIYLSAISPLLATATSIYTLLTTFLLLLFSPLCLLHSSRSLEKLFHHFLAPPLTLQLGLIFSSIDVDDSRSRPHTLVLVNAFAPVYAVGIALAAWVAAGFWFFAAILGDPNGNGKGGGGGLAAGPRGEQGRDDGKAVVMGVRRWWESWLIRGLVVVD